MTSSIVSRSFASVGIRIRQDDRYVCLTDMAKASGKKTNDWHRTKEAKDFISALSDDTGIPVSSLTEITIGKGKDQGTFAHPLIAYQFAQWCNPVFAIQVSRWLDELLTTGTVTINQFSSTAQLPSTQSISDLPYPDYTLPEITVETIDTALEAMYQLRHYKDFEKRLRERVNAFMPSEFGDHYETITGLHYTNKPKNYFDLRGKYTLDDLEPIFVQRSLDHKALTAALQNAELPKQIKVSQQDIYYLTKKPVSLASEFN